MFRLKSFFAASQSDNIIFSNSIKYKLQFHSVNLPVAGKLAKVSEVAREEGNQELMMWREELECTHQMADGDLLGRTG